MPGRLHLPAPNQESPSSSSCATSSFRYFSAATSLPGHSSPMSDEDETVLPPASNLSSTTTPPPQRTKTELTQVSPPQLSSAATRTQSFPFREDCWSEEATHTLIDAWGSHYVELNRGNLRQKHWQEVADAVNALHARTKKLHRTDIQCKNRIDTLKKKYKIEKSKFIEANGRYISPWPFFTSLNSLIGDNFHKNAPHSPSPPPLRKHLSAVKTSPSPSPAPPRKDFLALPPPPSVVPVGPRSKRPIAANTATAEDSFRRNFSAMAAAAAAVEEEEEEEDEESDTSTPVAVMIRGRKKKREDVATGYWQLAEAIGKFAEIYERVEEAKQRQIVELEKQRMQFAKDLEIQRMKLIVDSQVYFAKLKRPKRSLHSDSYS